MYACLDGDLTGACNAAQNQQRQEDVQSLASQARDGFDGTKEQFQAKEAEVQEVDREISMVEKALNTAQEEVNELTQRQAQLDMDIKEFQANERSSEADKVRYAASVSGLYYNQWNSPDMRRWEAEQRTIAVQMSAGSTKLCIAKTMNNIKHFDMSSCTYRHDSMHISSCTARQIITASSVFHSAALKNAWYCS
jgi:septal ring factor EnvC (AmiA/AmiB activator)